MKILTQKFMSITKNRIVFKIKTGYKLELLSNHTVKLLGDGPIIDKNKDGDSIPKLELVDVVLLHCNLVQNYYQQASKVLYTFVSNTKFDGLI